MQKSCNKNALKYRNYAETVQCICHLPVNTTKTQNTVYGKILLKSNSNINTLLRKELNTNINKSDSSTVTYRRYTKHNRFLPTVNIRKLRLIFDFVKLSDKTNPETRLG